ncbi:MAG: hypothetical protein DRN71_05210 [Candidatus Nanohalarchaeota archaeon]|nr:MAG: hypothetical protein DRN71_05210 [Candidatus Nanohaloarchaeota archaeon]
MKFKLFGRLTKKKPPMSGHVQSDRRDPHIVINELSAKGLPESEIIRSLKDEGYSFKEIDDALNESVRNEVTGAPPPMAGPPQGQQFAGAQDMGGAPMQSTQDQFLDQDLMSADRQDMDFSKRPQAFTDSTNMSPMMGERRPAGISMPEDAGAAQQVSISDQERENIYEIVESVVSERVNSLRSEMKEIGAQIKSIQQIIGEFKSDAQEKDDASRKEMGSVHEGIKDNSTKIIDMEPRVAGLERAFKDIVPNLVDSVREIKEFVAGHVGDVDAGHGHDAGMFDAPDAKVEDEHVEMGKKHEHDDIFGDALGGDKHESDAHKDVSTQEDAILTKKSAHKTSSHDVEDNADIFDESDVDERV